MDTKLELMDWKGMETAARAQIREGVVMVKMGEILLRHTEAKIRALGGKTVEEEVDEEKGKFTKSA